MARTTTLKTFPAELRLATKGIEPEAINAQLAAFARSELSAAITSGAGSPVYERFVNNRVGLSEDAVIAPGPILYAFSWWREIIEFALEYVRRRSPVRSGRYRSSWFVLVNGARVTDYANVPATAKVTITNDQPYSRKIEVGHMKMSVPSGIVEDSRRAMQRQYGKIVSAEKTFITLPGGYILKGVFSRGIGPGARRKLRPDVRKGQPVTYPAIVLTMKAF